MADLRKPSSLGSHVRKLPGRGLVDDALLARKIL